jgi:CO/xanthine dehydrogenase Mo-binding subunit
LKRGADAPLIHEDCERYWAAGIVQGRKGNILYHKQSLHGDIERGFREADRVFEHRFFAPMVHQTYIEPHAVLARVDASGRATVWIPTQAQFFIRQSIADIFQWPLIKVRVIPTEIGGGFGGKMLPTVEPAAVALAQKSGMPVQIVMSRAEDFQTANPRHPCHMRYKTGVMRDGTIVAREIELVFGTGAFCGNGLVIGQRAEMLATGPYRIPNVKIDLFCVYTHHANCGPYRAPSGPQLAFGSEQQIDIIARELNLDPVELRLKNAIEEGDTTPAAGGPLKSVHAKETLRKAAEAAGWGAKPREKNRGRGIALGYWLVGGMASSAGVKLNEDGTLSVLTGVVDLSGTVTSLGQIVAEVLGVDLEDVHIRTADSDFAPHSTISAGSQGLRSMGTAAKLAAEEVKKQIAEVAADKLEAEAGDLVVEGKRVYVKGTKEKGLSLGQVAQLSMTHKRGPIVSVQSAAQFPNQPAFSVHVADVEVEPETGQVKVLRYIAVQDVGTAINPLSARGQIQGSVIQGLGQALSEACVFKNGKMLIPLSSITRFSVPSMRRASKCIWSSMPPRAGRLAPKGSASHPSFPCRRRSPMRSTMPSARGSSSFLSARKKSCWRFKKTARGDRAGARCADPNGEAGVQIFLILLLECFQTMSASGIAPSARDPERSDLSFTQSGSLGANIFPRPDADPGGLSRRPLRA